MARNRIVNIMLDRVNARDRLAKVAGELEIGRRLEQITEGTDHGVRRLHIDERRAAQG